MSFTQLLSNGHFEVLGNHRTKENIKKGKEEPPTKHVARLVEHFNVFSFNSKFKATILQPQLVYENIQTQYLQMA